MELVITIDPRGPGDQVRDGRPCRRATSRSLDVDHVLPGFFLVSASSTSPVTRISLLRAAARAGRDTWPGHDRHPADRDVHACKAAIPHLIAGGRGGSIVITSSTAGLKGFQNLAPLRVGQARGGWPDADLGLELAPHSIRVNTLHPTSVTPT